MQGGARPVLVCYAPGLDARRLDERHTPYLAGLLGAGQTLGIRTLPCTELVPTLVSGTLPHQHRVWQVSLRAEAVNGQAAGLPDYLPDILVSTLQCSWHLLDRSYDLAVIPWRRRRRFELHRFKYTRRAESPASMLEFAGYPSIFGLLGARSRYLFTKDFAALPALAQELPTGQRLIEFVEMYALDLVQHWHLDNAAVMHDALARTDRFVQELHDNCRRRGVRLVVLVDHGQEPVVGTIDLREALRRSGVPETEYSYFIELASARLWFHTRRAREVLTERLAQLPHTTLLDWRAMHRYQVCFEDASFGEFYLFADAGRIFFPHDFYQPIGNALLGLMDHHQRQRVRNPVHRGNHGYLPHHASERGWLWADDVVAAGPGEDAELVDIAPTLLSLVGESPPDYMRGRVLFC